MSRINVFQRNGRVRWLVIIGMALALALPATGFLIAAPALANPAEQNTAAPAKDVGAAAAAASKWSKKRKLRVSYHDKCKGWYRLLPPYKDGNYIKSSVLVHCAKGGWGRKMSLKSTIQQYRGLGFWRTKATSSADDGSATPAFTTKLNTKWKCSGGSQLYRNITRIHIYSILIGSHTRTMGGDQRRIRC